MATGDSQFLSDGKAVDVDLLYTVKKNQLAVVDSWLGVTGASGDSGDSIALDVSDREFIFVVPTALAAVKGDIVYITLATVTGHTPDDGAYTKVPGAGKVALCKVTRDQDANDTIRGIMLAHNALVSGY